MSVVIEYDDTQSTHIPGLAFDNFCPTEALSDLTINASVWLDASIFDADVISYSSVAFDYSVDCVLPNGQVQSFAATADAANYYQTTISDIVVGSVCQMTENPPPATFTTDPPNQWLWDQTWATHYVEGQSFTKKQGAQSISVHNEQHFGQGTGNAQLHVLLRLQGAQWDDFGTFGFSQALTCNYASSGSQTQTLVMGKDRHYGGMWLADMGGPTECSIQQVAMPAVPSPLSSSCSWGGTEYLAGTSTPDLANLLQSQGGLTPGQSATFSGSPQNENYYLVVTNVLDCD